MSRLRDSVILASLLLAATFSEAKPTCSPHTDGVCWGIWRCNGLAESWEMSGTDNTNCCYDFQCNMIKNNLSPMRHICQRFTGNCVSTVMTKDEFMRVNMKRERGDESAGEVDPFNGILIKRKEVQSSANELNPEAVEQQQEEQEAEETRRHNHYVQHPSGSYYDHDNYLSYQQHSYDGYNGNYNGYHDDDLFYAGDDDQGYGYGNEDEYLGAGFDHDAQFIANEPNDLNRLMDFNFGLRGLLSFLRGKR